MQNSTMTTRCYCHFVANYPSISIKTEKGLGTWIVKNEKTDERELYKIFKCGHAVHDRCAKVIARLNQDFKESLECPMCSIDWTRPLELSEMENVEKGKPNIAYNNCLCNERIRVYKNDVNEWKPTIASFKAYPCGHGCHQKCHEIYWKIRKQNSDNCPLCIPKAEERRITELKAQVDELLTKVRGQHDAVKRSADNLTQELHDWRVKKHFITIGVLVVSASLMRFGHHATSIQNPIPLTKFTLGDVIVAVIALACSIIIGKCFTRSK